MARTPTVELRATLMAHAAPLWEEREKLLAQIAVLDAKLDILYEVAGEPKPAHHHPARHLASHHSESPQSPAGVAGAAAAVTRPPKTWKEFVMASLKAANGVATTAEIMAVVEGTELAEFARKYRESANQYHNAVRSLELAGKLIRQGRVLYDAETYAKIQSGEIADVPAPKSAGAGMPDFIVQALTKHGPLTAGGILRALREMPEIREIAERNPQLVYTHLSKMKARLLLIRERDKYKLPSQSNDIPPENITLFPGVTHG